ncbi:MAG: 30S ribosomal protein S5 [Proteobacteria bacterium]|nr:30S ribosomal protein S5 [Pseudomonadota bacterium]
MRSKKENIEISEKVVKVTRCTKVVKGGRKFSFSVLVVAGDGKGRIGIGFGKAGEVQDAKDKASRDAKNNMIRIPLREGRTVHHDISFKFGAGKVIIRSAPVGTGIIAGGSIRAFFEVMGVQDIVVKSTGSNNPHNMVKATLNGLLSIASPRRIADRRGKKVSDILMPFNDSHAN